MPRKSKPATKKKHRTRAETTALLAEAKAKGWTAAQVARKAGVSRWTVRRWRRAERTSKPEAREHLSRAERIALLAEAESKGWTAAQIAKRAGVSTWTVYDWRRREARKAAANQPKTKSPRSTRKAIRRAKTSSRPRTLDLRGLIAEIVREELAGMLGVMK